MLDVIRGLTIFRGVNDPEAVRGRYRYSNEVLEEILNKYRDQEIFGCTGRCGQTLPDFLNPVGEYQVPIEKVSHVIKDVRWNDNHTSLIGDVHICSTPMGQRLYQLFQTDDFFDCFYLAPAGIGTFTPKQNDQEYPIIDKGYKLLSIDVVQVFSDVEILKETG